MATEMRGVGVGREGRRSGEGETARRKERREKRSVVGLAVVAIARAASSWRQDRVPGRRLFIPHVIPISFSIFYSNIISFFSQQFVISHDQAFDNHVYVNQASMKIEIK